MNDEIRARDNLAVFSDIVVEWLNNCKTEGAEL